MNWHLEDKQKKALLSKLDMSAGFSNALDEAYRLGYQDAWSEMQALKEAILDKQAKEKKID